MKYIFVPLSIVFIFLSCQNGSMDKPIQELEKIYKVTYFSDEHISGEIPVDDNLYATGEWFQPSLNTDTPSSTLSRNTNPDYPKGNFYYVVKGATQILYKNYEANGAYTINNEIRHTPDGILMIYRTDDVRIYFGSNNIELHITWDVNRIWDFNQ